MAKRSHILVAIDANPSVASLKGGIHNLEETQPHVAHNMEMSKHILTEEKIDLLLTTYDMLADNEHALLKLLIQKAIEPQMILLTNAQTTEQEVQFFHDNGGRTLLEMPFTLNTLKTSLQKARTNAISQQQQNEHDLLEKLKTLEFFTDFSSEELLELLSLCTVQHYKNNEILFREGDTSDKFYVVVAGKIRIVKQTDDGATHTLSKLGRGICFGEMSIMDDSLRPSTAVAESNVLLFEVEASVLSADSDDLLTLKIYRKLAFIFARRLQESFEKITAMVNRMAYIKRR
jgi:CRP-like cAMP-binding protein